MTDEEQILKLSLQVMTQRLDILITACLDEKDKVKAPSQKDVMQARGYLPPSCKNAFPIKEKK